MYKDPCELLTTFWLNVAFLWPQYFYYVSYPALHVCIMLERFRATFLAEKYEYSGHRLGIKMTLAIVNLINLKFSKIISVGCFNTLHSRHCLFGIHWPRIVGCSSTNHHIDIQVQQRVSHLSLHWHCTPGHWHCHLRLAHHCAEQEIQGGEVIIKKKN